MYVVSIKNIDPIAMNMPGAVNVEKRLLVGPNHGWEGWAMRLFTISAGGQTPLHVHPWPHVNYVINGQGSLLLDGKEIIIQQGYVAYIPEGVEHQFLNRGQQELSFICIVPEEGEQ
ncbi:MAG: Cupin domain protein [Pelotomaculum sp. PtaB.Bin104]|nr:MAG: Cupin domain protein [Pelotomaculum sp. PtaB.Bin104]